MKDDIPEEIVDLVRFLADSWCQVDRWARTYMTIDSLGDYPVIQGTKNQIDILKIAGQSYESENVRRAVDWILSNQVIEKPSEEGLGD